MNLENSFTASTAKCGYSQAAPSVQVAVNITLWAFFKTKKDTTNICKALYNWQTRTETGWVMIPPRITPMP